MATEKTNPRTNEKKEPKIHGDKLKLKKERQSDTGKPTPPAKEIPKATREVDFMDWD